MVTRRRIVLALGAGALAAPLASFAQQQPRIPRIGILTPEPITARTDLFEAFRQGLRELGYVEGQNIAIEWRSAEGRLDRFPVLAAELVSLKVDVIFTLTTPGVRAAKQATATIPIIMVLAADPVATGLVTSLARPGGNVTGLTTEHPELSGKRLELLKETAPKVSRVALLWNPALPNVTMRFVDIQAEARALGITLQSMEVRSPDELVSAFEAATKERSGALIVLQYSFAYVHRKRITDFAAKHRLPVMYPESESVEAGGLISYGPKQTDLYRRIAIYVDKILKGANPATLPVEQPTKFELVINMKTAKALGIKIPNSILVRATKVIE